MEILLIPGFMLDADVWREVRPELERYGSVIDANTRDGGSIEEIAAEAILAMDSPTVVIGFSMGGYVARTIAYTVPDRVIGLALVATSSRGAEGISIADSAASRFHMLSRAAVVKSLHPDHRTDNLIARVQQMSERLGGAVFQRQSRIERYDDAHRLSEIHCQTVVVAGAEDRLRSITESDTLHAGIPGSTLTIIEHSGHLIPLEQPEALMSALKPLLVR